MVSIVIGSDNKGFDLKEKIKIILKESYGAPVNDVGTNNKMPCSYAEYTQMAVENILNGRNTFGILIDETGTGVSIAANRVRGIRACVVRTSSDAKLAKMYYDCNILCIGVDTVNMDEIDGIINEFLDNEFIGGKYANSLAMYD